MKFLPILCSALVRLVCTSKSWRTTGWQIRVFVYYGSILHHKKNERNVTGKEICRKVLVSTPLELYPLRIIFHVSKITLSAASYGKSVIVCCYLLVSYCTLHVAFTFSLHSLVMEWDCSLSNDTNVHPPVDKSIYEFGRMIVKIKRKYSKKTLSRCQSVYHKPHTKHPRGDTDAPHTQPQHDPQVRTWQPSKGIGLPSGVQEGRVNSPPKFFYLIIGFLGGGGTTELKRTNRNISLTIIWMV